MSLYLYFYLFCYLYFYLFIFLFIFIFIFIFINIFIGNANFSKSSYRSANWILRFEVSLQNKNRLQKNVLLFVCRLQKKNETEEIFWITSLRCSRTSGFYNSTYRKTTGLFGIIYFWKFFDDWIFANDSETLEFYFHHIFPIFDHVDNLYPRDHHNRWP